jgi:probable HAF family extracellular repeat protein
MFAFIMRGATFKVGTVRLTTDNQVFFNNKRQVAGVSANSNFTWRTVLWGKGSITDLKILSRGGANVPWDINNKGQVVGGSTTSPNFPFLWQNGIVTGLGGFPCGNSCLTLGIAYGINNAGRVVGASGSKAFIWYNKKMYDLNELVPADSGWKLEVARDINNRGQIVGWGKLNGKSEYRAFLLTPTLNNLPPRIPLPSLQGGVSGGQGVSFPLLIAS